MRTLIAFAIIVLLSSCQKNTVDSLFNHYKQDDNVIAATLPGWLVERGLLMAFKDDVEARNNFDNIVTNIKKVRVLVSTNKEEDEGSTIKDISSRMAKSKYELYAMVNNPDASFNFWVKEKKNKVRDVFLYINTNENVVLLQVKGNIDMDALKKVNLNTNSFKASQANL